MQSRSRGSLGQQARPRRRPVPGQEREPNRGDQHPAPTATFCHEDGIPRMMRLLLVKTIGRVPRKTPITLPLLPP